jgi:hypothetical protein
VKPLTFDAAQLDGIDEEILSVFQQDELLSLADVRGEARNAERSDYKQVLSLVMLD